jgi:hypothetical protein
MMGRRYSPPHAKGEEQLWIGMIPLTRRGCHASWMRGCMATSRGEVRWRGCSAWRRAEACWPARHLPPRGLRCSMRTRCCNRPRRIWPRRTPRLAARRRMPCVPRPRGRRTGQPIVPWRQLSSSRVAWSPRPSSPGCRHWSRAISLARCGRISPVFRSAWSSWATPISIPSLSPSTLPSPGRMTSSI